MKKTIISILIVIVFVVGLVFLTRMKRISIPTLAITEPVVVKELITKQPEMVSIAEDSYLFDINGSYPKFSQADAKFNKKIEDIVKEQVDSFKEGVNADYKMRLETGGDDFAEPFDGGGMYTYDVATRVIQSNDDYISAVIHTGGYSGGAHGFTTVVTFNYDVKNQKEIDAREIFSLEYASAVARNVLTERFTEDGKIDETIAAMIKDGTKSSYPINFEMFTFMDDHVTFYFAEYQVAPYVYGEQLVDVPRQ